MVIDIRYLKYLGRHQGSRYEHKGGLAFDVDGYIKEEQYLLLPQATGSRSGAPDSSSSPPSTVLAQEI